MWTTGTTSRRGFARRRSKRSRLGEERAWARVRVTAREYLAPRCSSSLEGPLALAGPPLEVGSVPAVTMRVGPSVPVGLKDLLHAARGTPGRTAVGYELQPFLCRPAVHGRRA